MLSRLAKAIKRGFRGIGKRGYTLLEVAAVVAVTGTLAAVVVPIAVDKTKEGKLVAAKQESQQIANAIAGFYKDTGVWPAYNSDTPSDTTLTYYKALRSGEETGAIGSAAHDPYGSGTIWSGVSLVDLLENHLVKDFPGGVNSNGYRTVKINWKGPYIESLASKRDPWGNNYLVYVKAMHTATGYGTGTEPTTKEYGWVISAGPNGILETAITAKDLAGDDIGVMLYSYEKPKD